MIWIVALGAIVAGFVQGLSGFAFALVAMSFWAWTLDPTLAAVLVVFGALTGQIIGAFSLRRKLDLPTLLPFLIGGLVGIPLGVVILPLFDSHLLKAALGLFLVIWCPVILLAPRLPPLRFGGRIADGLIGVTGGILSGLGGFAGAMPTLWCTLKQMEKNEQRAIVQNFNLTVLGITMATYIATGMVKLDMLPLFAIVAVAILVPTVLGARVYVGISDITFRRIVLGLLTASGIAMLAASVPELLARP